jgi:hypothetical protein
MQQYLHLRGISQAFQISLLHDETFFLSRQT